MSNLPKEKTNIEWMETAINSLRLDLPDSVVNKIQDKWNAHLSEQQSAIQELQKEYAAEMFEQNECIVRLQASIQELCSALQNSMNQLKRWISHTQWNKQDAETVIKAKEVLQKHKRVII